MSRFAPLSATAALAVALSVVAPLSAQEPVELSIVEAGAPAAGIGVFVLVEGEAWEVGATDAAGRLAAPPDLVGLEFGDLVAVREVACVERRSVVLVPPGAPGDAACAAVGPDCRCGSLGAFLWGDDVRVDLSARSVAAAPGERPPAREARPAREAPEPRARGPFEPTSGPVWTVAVGGAYAAWPNFDLACASAGIPTTTCDLESDGPMARAAVELRPWPDRPFGIAVDGSYAPGLEVDQAFPASAGGPVRNVVETDVWSAGGFGVGHLGVRERLEAFLAVGYVWAATRAEATTTFPGGLEVFDEREDSGGRVAGRAGLEYRPAGARWGVRLEAGGMTGEEDDLLAGWHAGGLVVVFLGGR